MQKRHKEIIFILCVVAMYTLLIIGTHPVIVNMLRGE